MTALGRWTIHNPQQSTLNEFVLGPYQFVKGPNTEEPVAVVPCDDAAVERAAKALCPEFWDEDYLFADDLTRESARDRVRLVFRAAGEET